MLAKLQKWSKNICARWISRANNVLLFLEHCKSFDIVSHIVVYYSIVAPINQSRISCLPKKKKSAREHSDRQYLKRITFCGMQFQLLFVYDFFFYYLPVLLFTLFFLFACFIQFLWNRLIVSHIIVIWVSPHWMGNTSVRYSWNRTMTKGDFRLYYTWSVVKQMPLGYIKKIIMLAL